MKKVLSLLFVFFILSVSISFVLPIKYDLGIKVIRGEQYTAVTFRYPFYTNTYMIDGNFPEADKVENITHKPKDEYYNLNDFEKTVYDSILTRAMEIFSLKTNSFAIKVPLDDVGIDENISTLNLETVNLINSTDFVKIFLALHKDYQWMFWFEENMTWMFRGPDVILTSEGVEGSFEIIIKPAEMFDGGNENLNDYALSLIGNINVDELKFDNIEDIQNYVIDKITYAHEDVDSIRFNTADEKTKVITKSITTFFEDDTPKMLCSGYSNVYQMLCDINGFECYTRTGEVVDENKVENHSWNVYYENGEKYLSDLTNSDSGAIGYKGELLNRHINEEDHYSIVIDNSILRYTEK